jgi:hypothetical protein
MIEWLEIIGIAIAIIAGLGCVILGLLGRKPADLTMGVTLLVELFLIVQLIVSITSSVLGARPTGNLLEFYVYLITALLLPPIAVLWALVDRNRWSTVVLGVASLAVAVMLYRMHQIWFLQVA